ncbi:MAG: 1-pyrroline-5-carboxylate dehydrogenase [Leifsonia xyli]|nr:MAG: 1-pyrroline-5-carboxylate dehydrogenase [Leifsonia xyli]
MAVPPDLPTVDETVVLVRRWLAAASEITPDAAAVRLARLLDEPDGLDFALGFVDRVLRPDDPRVAAHSLEQLSRRVPQVLPSHLRTLVTLGGGFGVLAPRPIIPLVRRVLREMFSHLVIEGSPKNLDKELPRLRASGVKLDLTLVGPPALGDRHAARRLAEIRELLDRDDVDRISVRIPSVAAQLSMWGFDETVDRVVELLRPLYLDAAGSRRRPLITLDLEEYRDLGLTIAVFTRLLEAPELTQLEAGITLQAYLPDSVAALAHLSEWAKARVASGGAAITVRLVKGAALAQERVDATLHGWPLATWATKQETDTNYQRMLLAALTADATAAVRVGVASHNLFDLAWAWLLASGRGVEHQLEIETLLGVASAQAQAVRAEVRRMVLSVPVVHPERLDDAIGYLAHRLEEASSSEGFPTDAAALEDPAALARETARFAAALAALDDEVPPANRTQNRLSAPLPRAPREFRNEPDTDPALVANRVWGRGILVRSAASALGAETAAAARVVDAERLDAVLAETAEAGRHWGRVAAEARAELLERVGEVLAVVRGRLVEVMAFETGMLIADADAEASAAVDHALYSAERARELDGIRDAVFAPVPLVLVAPSADAPVSEAAGGVLSALAAGSAVVLAPAPQASRCAAVLAEALWEAGVPRELLRLVDVGEGELAQRLLTSRAFGRVVLSGSFETAARLREENPELPLLAATRGTNAIVVTPSADLDRAIPDLIASAFGNAARHPQAASLAILVGSLGDSGRFRERLADAVASLAVGYPQEPAAVVGPLLAPPSGRLARALTQLEEGESWLVKPRQLDGSDRLWSPGVREGVVAGSAFHRGAHRAPVLGLMRAATLDEAIDLQNALPWGLAAGIQSLDADEVASWVARVQAGSLFVNRDITGAIVRRQPSGGWRRSAVGAGAGAKSGGPNALLVLGDWHPVPADVAGDLRLDGLEPRVRALIEAFQPSLDYAGFDVVRRGALSDAAAWAAEFGVARDVARLGAERNVFRYRPAPVTVRLGGDGSLAELVRVLAAAALARSPLAISSARPLRMADAFADLGWTAVVESDEAFAARAARELPERIRLLGGDAAALAVALGGSPEVAVHAGAVTAAGRIELLPFLREQSVTITTHRFGLPDRAMLALPLG